MYTCYVYLMYVCNLNHKTAVAMKLQGSYDDHENTYDKICG